MWKHRRQPRSIIVRSTHAVVVTIVLAAGLTMTAGQASAYTNVYGDSGCPHGFDIWTWASQWCERGGATMYQAKGYLTSPLHSVAVSEADIAKEKVSLFGGSPCTNYLEGGNYWYHPVGGSTTPIEYVEYKNGGTPQRFSAGSIHEGEVNVYWYSGTTTFGINLGAFDANHPALTVSGVGSGGCIAEGGLFISVVMGHDLFALTVGAATQNAEHVWYATNPVTDKSSGFTDWVIDDFCADPQWPAGACMNGAPNAPTYNSWETWK